MADGLDKGKKLSEVAADIFVRNLTVLLDSSYGTNNQDQLR